jgi:exonuclease 3'-5' domain-containing protein 2
MGQSCQYQRFPVEFCHEGELSLPNLLLRMSFLGSSELARIALRRSSKFLRISSLGSRFVSAKPIPCSKTVDPTCGLSVLTRSGYRSGPYMNHHISRMAATLLRCHQLWSPARGISFLPDLAAPISCAQPPHSLTEVPAYVDASYGITAVGVENKTWGEPIDQLMPPPQGIQSTSSTPDSQEPVEHVDGHSAGQSQTKDIEAKVMVEAEKKPTYLPPPAVLDYKIVADLFYAAKKAPSGNAKSFWSYTQYRRTGEDGKQQKVVLHYCRSKQIMEEVCRQYFKDEKLLGFDLEWVPDSKRQDHVKKNVSLIQLASPSRVALFHLALFDNNEDMVGPSFRSIMEDPTVIKAGVAIKGDTTRLRNYLNIDSRGLIELSNLYKLVTHSRTRQYQNINRKLVPLAKQVEEYLHLPLYKGQNVRSSDWSRPLGWDQLVCEYRQAGRLSRFH